MATQTEKGGAAFRPHASRQGLAFAVQVVRADLANFFLLHHRHANGFLITGKNSGTHWLKYMLSAALAQDWGVEPPALASGREQDAIISHPKWPAKYPGKPRIGSSHTIPSVAFALPGLCRLLPYRPTVVLVRDIREAMLSNYLKWNYGESLSDYAEGAPGGRKYVADAWWYVHFFNRWGDMARAHPAQTMVVRYEDLQARPEFWLRAVGRHYGFALSNAAVAKGLEFFGRDAIRERLGRPQDTEIEVVPNSEKRASMRFGAAELAVLDDIFRRHLRYDFGYGYLRGHTAVPAGESLVKLG